MPVLIEKDGPVTIITLSRPEVRNAVDRETAQELADAFRAFDSDASARVAVLSGDQGHFCAGADLTKIADGTPNRVEPDGDGPMGPTRMQLKKPVIAAIAGHAVAGGLELARQIAAFPQTCLRGDRMSAIEQLDLPFGKAMASEFNHGLASMANEAGQGAARFASGAGRHGEF